MTLPFPPPTCLEGQRIDLEVRLCADQETTLLERVHLETLHEVVDMVLSRFGLPDAVLRDETAPGQPPIGWVVPAPASVSTSGRPVYTPFGRLVTPPAHVELVPVVPGFGFTTWPALPLALADDGLARELANVGLLDAADVSLWHLWDVYTGGFGSTSDPQARFDALLSVHTRARSTGAMLLAAHAADSMAWLLHRCGSYGAAAAMLRWAVGVYARGGHQQDRAMALVNLAHVLWHDGQPAPAAQAGALARRIAASEGMRDEQRRAGLTTAYALVDLDRTDDALSLLDRDAPATTDPLTLGWFAHARGTARLATGDTTAAASYVRSALAAAARVGDQVEADSLRAEAHLLAAAIATSTGGHTEARAATARAEACRAGLPAPFIH